MINVISHLLHQVNILINIQIFKFALLVVQAGVQMVIVKYGLILQTTMHTSIFMLLEIKCVNLLKLFLMQKD